MAEFCSILLSFSNISITIVGVGGMGDGAGWGEVGGGKNPHLGHPMSSHDAHTLVGHRVSGSKPRSPSSNWHPPLVPLFQS